MAAEDKNKNTTMLHYWSLCNAPVNVEKIIIYFPIVGYTFIPPDGAFGNFEREFRGKRVIPKPETYLLEKYATVIRLAVDYEVSQISKIKKGFYTEKNNLICVDLRRTLS